MAGGASVPIDVRIVQALVTEAYALADIAARTYADAYRAGMRPDDLRQHVEAVLSPQRWRDYLAADTVLVARIGNEIVGYVQFGPTLGADAAEIKRLYVDAPWQGRGLGSRLLQAAIAALETAGADTLWIDVWHDNAGAQRLYERFGFVAVGTKAFVLPSGQVDGHDIRMIRRQG